MTPFEAYKIYLSIKLHFSSEKYDYFQNNGKTRGTQASFEKRRDKAFFFHLAKKADTVELDQYLVPLFLEDSRKWVGDILQENNDELFYAWQKRMQSLTYTFKNDIKTINMENPEFNNVFKVPKNKHPLLMQYVLHDEIQIETFIIMNKILNFFPQFDKDIENPVIWNELRKKCLKYEPFLGNIDVRKYRDIMRDILCPILNQQTPHR